MFDLYSSDLKPISCSNCGKVPPKLLRCTACKTITYCNVDCQRRHWRQCHKKECKGIQEGKRHWEEQAKQDLESLNDATGLFILGEWHGLGVEGTPVNHELACKLYEAATKVQTPIAGGHPNAMLHLALHYERGLGVDKSYEIAYQYYKSVIEHPFPGEDTVKPAFLALSRFHKEGYEGVEKSAELSAKYYAFSESNPETAEEIQDLEKYWESGGKDMVMKLMESPENK